MRRKVQSYRTIIRLTVTINDIDTDCDSLRTEEAQGVDELRYRVAMEYVRASSLFGEKDGSLETIVSISGLLLPLRLQIRMNISSCAFYEIIVLGVTSV